MGKTSDLVNERVYRVNAHNRWYAWMRRWSFTDNKQFLNNHIYTHMFTNSVIVGVKNGRSSEPVKCHYKVGTSTPIAFDLNADGKIGVTGESTARDAERNVFGSTVEFDMLGTDKPITMEWFAGDGDGILIDNRDGQAATDMNGKRLFGDQNGQFEHGYQRLALFDINTDGVLTATELQGLQLWVDNGDAIVQPGELQSLKAWKIASISVQMTLVDGMMRSTATTTSGQQIMTEDVWFSVVPAVASTTPSIVSTLTVSLAALLAILMAAFVFVRQQKTVVTQDNAMRPELES